MRRFCHTVKVLLATAIPLPAAGYDDATGFNQLKASLGVAMLTGTGVGMTQVEATPATDAYLPQAGSATFVGTGYWAGKFFTAKSGSGLFSSHAYEVGLHMYGSNTSAASFRASMTPDVVDVDGYNANSWDDDFLAPLPSAGAPASESRAVQNHSWIYEAGSGQGSFINDLLLRQDYSINRDNYVCCVGLNNGSLSEIPDLFAAGYNVISVGLTNGEHSRGTTTSDVDGPGRRKPEIVAPLDATSFSTAYVSSAAALLRQKANQIGTTNARNSRVLRAVLMAGATKEEFPAWAKTTTHPIDSVFGAGELNIFYSYTILDGGEQPENNASGRPYTAWDYASLAGGGTAYYRLNVPAGFYGQELSAFIVWNRTPADSPGGGFTLSAGTLLNFDLTLYRDPAAGGSATVIDTSNSTLYPYEHVFARSLPAGNYRLRVNRITTGSSAPFAIAWRLHTRPHQPQPEMHRTSGDYHFSFPDLIPGQPYHFQSSADCSAWTSIYTFTAATPFQTYSTAVPGAYRMFYRLQPVLP